MYSEADGKHAEWIVIVEGVDTEVGYCPPEAFTFLFEEDARSFAEECEKHNAGRCVIQYSGPVVFPD